MTCACRPFFFLCENWKFHSPPISPTATTASSTTRRIPRINLLVSWNTRPLRSLSSSSLRVASQPSHSPPPFLSTHHQFPHATAGIGYRNNSGGGVGGGGGGGGGCGGGWNPFDDGSYCGGQHYRLFSSFLFFLCSRNLGRRGYDSGLFSEYRNFFFLLLAALGGFHFAPAAALARAVSPPENKDEKKREDGEEVVWEVKGGKWIRLFPDPTKDDEFVVSESSSSSSILHDGIISKNFLLQCKNLLAQLMLPEGFPHSVTSDYLDYSLWRGIQGIASQISGVLATQSLLFAVGLGKGAIPTAAAVNWVLKDGIWYASKILLSKYGRHFDVNPKGWRLFADLLENAAFGLEMLTPAFPHLFVMIGAAAAAGRSAAALIQAATRSCFYAGFAAQRNFAEVIAKGEAQGMVSKSIGIMIAIPLANCIGSSTSLALITFGVVTWIHMYCNLKSYQSIQLRTLNPYRASLVFSEYLLSGQVPSIKEVNDEEPLFPALPVLNVNSVFKERSEVLSAEAKDAAVEIEQRLQLGSKLSDVVNTKEDVCALFDLYKNECYILIEHKENFCVILEENSSPRDMLKSVFHVNYLYWLERHAGIKSRGTLGDCRPGGRLQTSLEYVQREFNHVKTDGEFAGWVTDGLIARPLPNRIRPGNVAPCLAR